MTQANKITKATFKSFIKKNAGNLYVKYKSSFDGMIDGCSYDKNPQWVPVVATQSNLSHSFGINGAWLVGGGRDYFSAVKDGEFEGIHVYNCCGSFDIAVKSA